MKNTQSIAILEFKRQLRSNCTNERGGCLLADLARWKLPRKTSRTDASKKKKEKRKKKTSIRVLLSVSSHFLKFYFYFIFTFFCFLNYATSLHSSPSSPRVSRVTMRRWRIIQKGHFMFQSSILRNELSVCFEYYLWLIVRGIERVISDVFILLKLITSCISRAHGYIDRLRYFEKKGKKEKTNLYFDFHMYSHATDALRSTEET